MLYEPFYFGFNKVVGQINVYRETAFWFPRNMIDFNCDLEAFCMLLQRVRGSNRSTLLVIIYIELRFQHGTLIYDSKFGNEVCFGA